MTMLMHTIVEILVKLVRKQTYVTVEQDQRVKRLAEHYQITEAAILRRALDSWLANEMVDVHPDPFAGLIGFVDVVSEAGHDEIYR